MTPLIVCLIFIGLFASFYLVPLYSLLQYSAPKGSKGSSVATSNFICTIGAILVGWVMDKVRPAPVISAAYVGGGLCVLALGWIGAMSSSLTLLVFLAGFCMSGAQTGLNAFAPSRYPTVARATGVHPALPAGLADLFDRPERYVTLPNDLAAVEAQVRALARRNRP